MTLLETFTLIKLDIKRRMESDGLPCSPLSILKTIFMPSSMVVIIFRLSKYFYAKRIYIISKLLTILNIVLFSTEIQPGCEIGGGFLVGHADGIAIHKNAKIGKNCTFMHQSTVGLRERQGIPLEELTVVIEDGVLLGAGARVIGPLTVGKFSQIGMNCVVTSSVPPYSVVVGIPGKVIRKVDSKNTSKPRNSSVEPESLRPAKGQVAGQISFRETFSRIKMDIQNRARVDGKRFGLFCYLKLFFNPTALAVVIYRFQHLAYCHGLDIISKVLNIVNVVMFSVEIGSKAQIEGGLVLGHCLGIIINENTVIGKNCVFFHHNTVAIGPRSSLEPENDRVIIGNEVVVGAGARILGNVTVGNNCIIGMNAVVTKSIPPYSVAAGIPAKVIKKVKRTGNGSTVATPKKSPGVASKKRTVKRTSFRKTLQLIRSDIEYRYRLEGKPFNKLSYLKVFLNPPVLAVVIFRFQHWFATHWMPFVAKLLAITNILLFSVDIGSKAEIAEGLVLAHACGIVINDSVSIGKRCIFTMHNTIAIGPRDDLRPERDKVVIGDDVFIGIGSRIVGNITIGSNSILGMNCVVTKNIPPNSVVVGIPGRVLKERTVSVAQPDEKPS